MAIAIQDETPIEFEILYIEVGHTNYNDLIAWLVKYMMKEMAAKEMKTIVKKSLANICGTLSHDAKTAIRSIVYNVFEQLMFGLLCKDLIGETVDRKRSEMF